LPGWRVPDDVALIGFDGSPIAWHTNPPMTSVRQPAEERGRTLAGYCCRRSPRTRRHVVLAAELVRWEFA